jgi:hypothetical protein
MVEYNEGYSISLISSQNSIVKVETYTNKWVTPFAREMQGSIDIENEFINLKTKWEKQNV